MIADSTDLQTTTDVATRLVAALGDEFSTDDSDAQGYYDARIYILHHGERVAGVRRDRDCKAGQVKVSAMVQGPAYRRDREFSRVAGDSVTSIKVAASKTAQQLAGDFTRRLWPTIPLLQAATRVDNATADSAEATATDCADKLATALGDKARREGAAADGNLRVSFYATGKARGEFQASHDGTECAITLQCVPFDLAIAIAKLVTR